MIFNPCTSVDFMPELCLDDNELEVVDEVRLLGLIIRSDLKWVSNTDNMVTKANKKLWILRRLKYLGAEVSDLVDIYMKQIRSWLHLYSMTVSHLLNKQTLRGYRRVPHTVYWENAMYPIGKP